ncbi:hypothetical protein [Kitasatospora sp. NPDC057198]|uniref:hypothetical protein n=1 Tax=Kitasatospora sp. NPDC057198 TaxID=3346046 RepID=UPI003628CEA2
MADEEQELKLYAPSPLVVKAALEKLRETWSDTASELRRLRTEYAEESGLPVKVNPTPTEVMRQRIWQLEAELYCLLSFTGAEPGSLMDTAGVWYETKPKKGTDR